MTNYRIDEMVMGDGTPVFRMFKQRARGAWSFDGFLPRYVKAGTWEPVTSYNLLSQGDYPVTRDNYESCVAYIADLQAKEARFSEPEKLVKSTKIPGP